jgi:hypothetical protein
MQAHKARYVLRVGEIYSFFWGGGPPLHIHAGGGTHKNAVVVSIVCNHGTNQFDSFYRS